MNSLEQGYIKDRAVANYQYFPEVPVILPFGVMEHIQNTCDALPEEYQNQVKVAMIKQHNAYALSMAAQDIKFLRRIKHG